MSVNGGETSPRFRLVMRVIGIAVALIPAIVLMVAPAPIGFSGDYVGPKGMAFLFFILSVPAGLFIINFGKNPTRTKRILLIVVGIWAGLSALALIGDVFNRLIHGTL
ncbi:MAG: hypothetical protein NTW23_00695 [Rhodoluna sp.]|nr:hypothetical protein [Rhodoluna sp.]